MNIARVLPVALLALLTACAQKNASEAQSGASADPSVATVNGTPITRSMFEYFVKSSAGKSVSELTAEQRDHLLDTLIGGEVIAQQAEKQGLDKTGDNASLLQLTRLQILQQAAAENFLKDKKPTDVELKTEYDAQVAAMPKTQYHARHILVSSEQQAKDIIAQLKKGAKFEVLAKKYSLDSSKNSGGDLSWFSPSSMVKPFADAVASLKKGQYTEVPVQTQYGWHVIQLLDTRDMPVPPFDQVKDRVAQIIQGKQFKAFQDELIKQATIVRTPEAAGPVSSGAAPAAAAPPAGAASPSGAAPADAGAAAPPAQH